MGHLTREFSSRIAPILDQYAKLTDDVAFNIHLNYSDTNHTRAGYEIDIVVMSNCSLEFNNLLEQQLLTANLHPRIF